MGDYVKKYGEVIPRDIRSLISMRYHAITKSINIEFWNTASDEANSFYVGSYGRGTAVDSSDIDVLVELPETEYKRYNASKGNGQSRLLQAVREAVLNSYPRSDIRADGQVVKILFSDGMKFEILPAFKILSLGIYQYPDSNMGGNWKSTNPKIEQKAMRDKNVSSNGLLYDTCKHIRYIRDNYYSSYHLPGIVIDSFVFEAISGWSWTKENETSSAEIGEYEDMLLDYLNRKTFMGTLALLSPGSGQTVTGDSSIGCFKNVLEYMTS